MSTASAPNHSTLLSPREVRAHLAGLALFIGVLVLWYWMSTGARAVPALIGLLHEDDPSSRIVAAEQLGHIGPAAAAAVPDLIAQATKDPLQHANTTAAAALKSIDLAATRHVMTRYIPLLQDQDIQLRRTACAVLGSLGPVAKPAVPALVVVSRDADELVRRNALSALAAIGLPSPTVTAALIAGLHDPDPLVRQAVVMQFAFSHPIDKDAGEALTALATDADATIATLAKTALDRHARDGASRVETFGMMLRGSISPDYALLQLAQLGPAAAAAIPNILPMLQHRHPLYRYLTAETLGAMGPSAAEGLSALEQARNDPDPVVRASVAEALAAITQANTP